jgi:hypothetical protein
MSFRLKRNAGVKRLVSKRGKVHCIEYRQEFHIYFPFDGLPLRDSSLIVLYLHRRICSFLGYSSHPIPIIYFRVFTKVTFGISRKSKFYTKMVLISRNFEYFHRPRMSLQGPRVSLQGYRVRLHGSKINLNESRVSLHGPRVILHEPMLSMKTLYGEHARLQGEPPRHQNEPPRPQGESSRLQGEPP